MDNLQFFLPQYESSLRIFCFFVLLLLFILLERFLPAYALSPCQTWRRFNNFVLHVINSIVSRLLLPLATFEMAFIAAERGYGLFNTIPIPLLYNVLFTIIVFDLLMYLQHVAFHKCAMLWRIHRVHHSDTNLDVTTGIRFHPFEIILSLLYRFVAVCLLGPSVLAIIVYEILLNSAALFTHSNISIPSKCDIWLRSLFVTPNMHRIHHSAVQYETDSNYGNLFSWWDKLFRTYRLKPEGAYGDMVIGLNEFRDAASYRLLKILTIPFLTNR